jgi:hypothetical protein
MFTCGDLVRGLLEADLLLGRILAPVFVTVTRGPNS